LSDRRSLPQHPELDVEEREAAPTEGDTAFEPAPPVEAPKRRRQRARWLSGVGWLALGLGLGAALTWAGDRWLSSRQQTAPPAESEIQGRGRSVTVARAQITTVERRLEASGTVEAQELSEVAAQASGLRIERILVEEGDRVRAGQLLARLDAAQRQAQLEQAQASVAQAQGRLSELQAGTRPEQLAQARASVENARAALDSARAALKRVRQQVKRNRFLAQEGAVAQDRLDELLSQQQQRQAELQQAQANLEEAQQRQAELEAGTRPQQIAQARAQLQSAQARARELKAQLQNTRVVAPVGGIVTDKQANVGEVTSGSQTLFRIVEGGRLQAQLKVPEAQLNRVQRGQTVKIRSAADRSRSLTGTVANVRPQVAQESRQGIVEVDLPAGTALRPGMFVQAAIVTATERQLTVPSDAVIPEAGDRGTVYVLQPDSTVKAREVALGTMAANGRVAIAEGLSAGDRVVVKGAPYLNDGARVQVSGS